MYNSPSSSPDVRPSSPPAAQRARIEWLVTVAGLVTLLVTLVYCGWIIVAQAQRVTRFEVYVHERDARWERYVERTDASLKAITEQLTRIEAKR
jgi:hypothetical protein